MKEPRSLNPLLPSCIQDTQNTNYERKPMSNSSGHCVNPNHSELLQFPELASLQSDKEESNTAKLQTSVKWVNCDLKLKLEKYYSIGKKKKKKKVGDEGVEAKKHPL